MAAEPTSEVLRILLATDIHLGYAEGHPEKKEDSFIAFREIMRIATEEDVDLILLGGDLFHKNVPSKDSELKAMSIMRPFVMGDRPISIEMLSDPNVDFSHCQRKSANFLDENLNISMPIFSIHGNHDDPVRGISCMDPLHESGLLNYFGKKTDNLASLEVSPLLIGKGNVKLAIYGISALKEERLHRLFRDKKVSMARPTENTDDWFNLLVVHQNRAKHGSTNYLPEHFIDDFFHLVFWGHEHECRIEPEPVAFGDKAFHVTQPGSSVATSLCKGEAKKKHVGVLKIAGADKFDIKPIELKTVRPMIFRTICLDDAECAYMKKGTDKEIVEKVTHYLKSYVEELLAHDVDELLTGHPEQPKMPQIRLRVEYSEEKQVILPGRFGNYFVGKVANHSEILLFKKRLLKKSDDGNEFLADVKEGISYAPEGTSMEELVAQYFQSTDEKNCLKLLSTGGISGAVQAFIEKDNKKAIDLVVEAQLEKASHILCSINNLGGKTEEIDAALELIEG